MTLITADQLDTSPPRYAVEGMIPEVGAGIAHGPSYAGKSLAIDVEMALAVANGTPYLGHQAAKGNVVLCLGEGLYDAGCRKQARLSRQARDDTVAITAAARDHGDEAARALAAALPAYTDERLYVVTEPFTVALSRGGELPPGMRQVMAQLAAIDGGIELIILDALADFTGGLSLSNDSSANRIMMGLKAMSRELDTAVVAVAHNDKAGTRLLGAQRLVNASDFVISFTPDDVTAPGADKTAAISCEKSKFGPEFEPLGYRVEPCEWDQPAEDDDGNQIPGEMITVKSATIRLLEHSAAGRAPEPQRQPAPLPEIRSVERPHKRSGIRPARGGLRAVPDLPAAPGQRPLGTLTADADARRTLVAAVLANRCPVCSRSQAGCDGRMAPQPMVIGRTLAGPLLVHDDRLLAAALSQPDPEGFLDNVIEAVRALSA